MTEQTVLLVGHGSRDTTAIAEFNDFAAALSLRVDRPVLTCFLELADPDLATGLSSAAAQAGPGGQVVVLPLFLGPAGHLKNDVAAAIQWARGQFPGVSFGYGTSLGFHARLIELLDYRVNEALAGDGGALPREETSILVVGRGSSDPHSNAEIARGAYLLFEGRPYRSVEYGYQSVARPRVDEALVRCQRLGARQVVVAPFILFTGEVDRNIRRLSVQAAGELGLRLVQAGYLSPHPLLLDVTAQRLQEASGGQAAMTCDLCKYRFPMAGYEHQVGQVQTTHHLYGGSAHSHDHHHHHNDHDHDHHHDDDHHDHEHEGHHHHHDDHDHHAGD